MGSGAPETELSFLLVEFTDEGAETMDAVILRMLESAFAVVAGSSSPANQLQVDIDGDEFRTMTLPTQFVARVQGTNVFGMALLSTSGRPLADTIQETRDLFGDDPVVDFVEIYGAFDEDVGLTGDDLARAYAGTHSASGLPIVNIEFNGEGARRFGELTQEIAGTTDLLAIFLDDEELIAPGVTQAITGGAAFIQGRDFTPDRARDIAQLLEAGRLPIPIELVQERDVDAILGADSLRKSVIAGLIGLALVLVFLVAYYRVPGLVAAVALIIYGVLMLAIFKILPVTLTLSGLAAAILSVGMAVDANILIFERMKDELRAGRTLLTSINIGFNRAWPAIRDGNVSTLITCAILFWFADTLGATVVQGFAATLAIGVMVSMFSAIVVSRTLLRLVATTPLASRVSWFAPVGKRFLPTGSR
jgi:preprotein translocase subunit SecD